MDINDKDFNLLVNFVRKKYGINLAHKRQLINARLAFDIARCGYSGFTEYIQTVIENPTGSQCRQMMNRLSTNYTFFFRETDYIDQICNTVLKDFLSNHKKKIKIWCAACSSGQEAYSVAMVLEAYKSLSHAVFDYEIVATDINTETLSTAASAIYPDEELSHIPTRYRCFVSPHANHTIQICDKIRSKITWSYNNLLEILPTDDRYDIVFCRNVMIYFTAQLRQEMVFKLHCALLPGGYLYTGATESVDLERKYFRYIAPSFYQKPILQTDGEQNEKST